MKHLKVFEGTEDSLMNIYSDDVKECFYDLSDNGWVINTRFAKKMFSSKSMNSGGEFSLDLLPLLEIRIHKKLPIKVDLGDLLELQMTYEYKECIDKLKGVLDSNNLLISQEKIERIQGGGSQIYILIYRKSDENYIK